MKNKKIKLALSIVIFISIVSGGVVFWRQEKQRRNFGALPTPTAAPVLFPAPISENIDWEIYNNTTYGIEIKYPSNFEKALWENFEFSNVSGNFKGIFLMQLKIPKDLVKSEFYNPDIRIEIDNEDVCGKLDKFPDVDEKLTSKEPFSIGGIMFDKKEKKDTSTTGGALYDKVIYYTKRNGKCYSVALFNIVYTSKIELLDGQGEIVKEQNLILENEKDLVSLMEQKILPTFKFLE